MQQSRTDRCRRSEFHVVLTMAAPVRALATIITTIMLCVHGLYTETIDPIMRILARSCVPRYYRERGALGQCLQYLCKSH